MNIFKRLFRRIFRITFADDLLSIQDTFIKAKERAIKLEEEMLAEKTRKESAIKDIQHEILVIENHVLSNSKFIDGLSKLV